MQGEIPLGIARALRQMRSHPAVRSADLASGGDAAGIIVHIAAGLPSRWEAEGTSPNGVRAVEAITFRFQPGYPITPPRLFLRADFNRAHPHLQPGSATNLPEPCLVMGSAAELLATRGIHGLLDQLVLWLRRAAEVDLINPTQGWEPIRRDLLDHVLVADAALLRSCPKRDAGWCVYTSYGHTQTVQGKRYHSLLAFRQEKRPAFPKDLLHDLVNTGPGATLTAVIWSGKNPDGTPFIAGQYRPDSVTTVADLHTFAREIGSGSPLDAALSLLQQRLREGTVTRPIPVAIVLLARRPFAIIGEDSPWEIIPYILEINGRDDLSATSIKAVFPALHRHALTPDLLARVNGVHGASTLPWTLLGCGSVGSKIALHLARAGLGPAQVIDKATMAPHNYARHGLLVQSVIEEMIPLPKATLLAEALKPLRQKATSHHVNILTEFPDLPAKAVNASDTAFIVNATGALSVRDALIAHSHPTRARLIETCLLAEGRIGYLAVEGPNGNPSAADLAVEFYRLAAEDRALAPMAFASDPVEIPVGQGCSSLTMRVTDAALSALSAAMATQIQRWLVDGLPSDTGHLFIGLVHSDGMGQTWSQHAARPWIVVPAKGKPLSIRISPSAHAKIEAQIAEHPGVETGGVLLGRWSEVTSAFSVVDVIPAPSDSFRSKHLFILGIDGVKEKIANLVHCTQGVLHALGTWHNHLTDSGPSRLDRQTAHLLARNQHHPALLLIHTPRGYRALLAEAVDRTRRPTTLTAGDPD